MTKPKLWGAAGLVLAAALLLPYGTVGAVGAGDPRSDREQVRQQKAEVAAQLDALRASDAQIQQALGDISANVGGQEAMLQDAQRALDQANAEVEAAKVEQARTEAEIAALEALLRTMAVSAYVHGTNSDALSSLSSSDINDAVKRQALLSFRTGQETDVADQLRAAQEDLAIKRKAAEDAARAADERRAEITGRLEQLHAAQAQQQQFAAAVDQRIEAALAESANLDSLDKKLADQIAAQQAALAARNVGGGVSSGGSHSVGNISLVTVGGITVNALIADQLAGLLDAAAADGFSFGGGGYRDPAAQIALRRAHCGTSDYEIYEMPPAQCHPPTARPGSSMHEQGLAIDFTWNGSIVSSRSSPAYQWLAANAGSFGLYNLPSEPWHWSVNGQ